MRPFNKFNLPVMDSVTLFFIISNSILIFIAGPIIDAVSDLLKATNSNHNDVQTFLRWCLFIINSIVFFAILKRYNVKLLNEADLRRASEDHLRLYAHVFQSAQEGILITDANTRIITVNHTFTRLTGYTLSEVVGKSPSILRSGSQDRAFYREMWTSIRQTGSWQGEVWNQRKDGTMYPEWLIINSVTDGHGKIIHYFGIFSDMSRRKEHEAKLRMHASVFESSNEGIIITDTKGTILSVNPSFTLTTGYTAEEAIGRTPKILHSGRQDKTFYDEMWASIHDTGSWQGEIWNKRKSGKIYPEWLTIKSVKGDHGDVATYVAIFSDITERKQAEENLKYLAHYDVLTGLPNRRHFQNNLNLVMQEADRSGTKVGLLFIDLDRFKVINDSLGHEIGDRLLVQAGQRLCDCIGSKHLVSRLGGDEFTVILPNISGQKEAAALADEILREFSKVYQIGDHEFYITGSIGISIYPTDGKDLDTLVKHADSAMYVAKEQRNDYKMFVSNWAETLPRRLVLENGLRKAIAVGQLEVYYQPQMDCRTGRLVGLEALTRWNHPEFGLVSPAEFIPIAEEIGIIADMDEWVLEQVCAQNTLWRSTFGRPVKIAVNLSAKQLHRPHLVEFVQRVLHTHRLEPEFLEIEITESVSLKRVETTIKILDELRRIGVCTAIDDFGTGHSALVYLKRFNFSVLKIDKTFISGLDHDPTNRTLVKVLIDMAHALGLSTVAEGVETREELDLLKQIGCDTAQGYYMSRPLPSAAMEAYLRNIGFDNTDVAADAVSS